MQKSVCRLVCLLLVVLVNCQLVADVELDKTKVFLPHLLAPFPVRLALPNNFVARSVDAELPGSLVDGMLWGKEETIKSIWAQAGQKSMVVTSGVFRASLTLNVSQTGPDQFSVGTDEQLRRDLESAGATEIKIRRIFWGTFPVIAISYMSSKGKPGALAWIGLNFEENVLLVNYIFPEGLEEESYTKDFDIWNTFLDKSQMIPQKMAATKETVQKTLKK